jgi:hypothetical protein
VRDEAGEVESVAVVGEDDVFDLGLEFKRGAVGAHESLLIHADDGGIKGGFAVLGCGEEEDAAAGAGGIHGGADEGVAGHGEDDGIGSAAFAGVVGGGDYVFLAGVYGVVESIGCSEGVAFGVEVGGEDFCAGAGGAGGEENADGTLTDDEDGFVGLKGEVAGRPCRRC